MNATNQEATSPQSPAPNSSWLKTFSIGFSIVSFGITIAIVGYIVLTTKQAQPVPQPSPTPTIDETKSRKTYRSLEEALREPDKVYYLDLSNKNLTQVPSDILRFHNLKSLYLNFNKLTDLPEDLAGLKNLETIDLTGNPVAVKDSAGIKKIIQLRPDIKVFHIIPMNPPQ